MSKLDQALEDLDLEAWIEGYDDVKSGGTHEIRVQNCPNCGNSKYKLYVNVEKQRWICYVCDWGRHQGDVCTLLAAISGRPKGAIQIELAKSVRPAPKPDTFAAKLSEAFFPPSQEPPEEVQEVVLPGEDSFTGIISGRVRDYAYTRGLTDRDLEFYEFRAATKLRRYSGPFLVFPVFMQDIPVAWQGRRIVNREPKYVSSDDISDWLWPMPEDHDSSDLIILVEGVFDALALLKYDYPACCTFGKKISKRQLRHLQRHRVLELAFAWDAHEVTAIEREARRARGIFPKVSAVDFRLPNKAGVKNPDPGDCLTNDKLVDWLCCCITNRIDVDSTEFYHWRLKFNLGVR